MKALRQDVMGLLHLCGPILNPIGLQRADSWLDDHHGYTWLLLSGL